MIRLLEVLLHGGSTVGGWTARQIHQSVLTTFPALRKRVRVEPAPLRSAQAQRPRPARAHGSGYAYRLTAKGVQVALLFLFFHKRLCGPLANSRLHHQPDSATRRTANSKPLIRNLTRPFNRSSICSPQRDVTARKG
jgi:hypothetical protein